MAITPDGKTLYDISWGPRARASSYVIPISTATNTPGKPIKIQSTDAFEILMNPDGKTVYVIGRSATGTTEIVPISTATNTPGEPVSVAGRGWPGDHAGRADPLPRLTAARSA